MPINPTFFGDKLALMFTVFILGIRHGFELDHLAVIDSIIGCTNAYSKLAKWVGCLFSFGHGIIIILLALFIAFEATKWTVPIWFEQLGLWISISCLLFFGVYCLYAALQKNHHYTNASYGLKSYLFNKHGLSSGRATVLTPVFTGMLFSLSFDTISVTTVFALNGYALGGALLSVMLAVIFMLGMIITDGFNGYFITRILNRATVRSRKVSRVLNLIIAIFSIVVGGYYLINFFLVTQ